MKSFACYDYLCILLNELKKNGMIKFSQKQLEKNLYCYMKDPKYSILFLNYDIKDGKLNLSKALNNQNISRSIISMDYDLDIKYITSTISVCNEKYDVEILDLIKSLAQEYIIRENIYKRNNIRIYNINPNNNYSLINGFNGHNNIRNVIVTNGDIETTIEGNIRKINVNNPDNLAKHISLKNTKYSILKITNSTYTMVQTLKNDKIISSILYTNIIDNLEEILNMEESHDTKVLTLK